MNYSLIRRITNNTLVLILAVAAIMCSGITCFADDEADEYYGYTVPEMYREDGNRYGHYEYEGYPIYVTAVDENNNPEGEATPAYCFNISKKAPDTIHGYPGERSYYEKVAGDGDTFKKYATDSVIESSSDLEKRTLNVLYKGYPNNGSGIKEKYNLNEEQFRFVTQYAVWYLTDNVSNTLLTGTDDMKKAFLEMIKDEDTNIVKDSLGNDMTLEFYIAKNERFQNLIGTAFKKAADISGTSEQKEEPVVEEEIIEEDTPVEEDVSTESEEAKEEVTPLKETIPAYEITPITEPAPVEEVTPTEDPTPTEELEVASTDAAEADTTAPHTGDGSLLILYALAMIMSVILAVLLVRIRKLN